MPRNGKRKMFKPRRKVVGRGRKPWYAYGKSISQIASTALAGVGYLKGLINAERKFLDTSYAITTQTTTGAVVPVSVISEGNDYNNRQGLSIKLDSMLWRGTFNILLPSGTATQTSASFRYMLVMDLDNQSATPAVTDILETADVNSPLNHTNGKRFKVILDKRGQLDYNGNGSRTFKHYKKLNDHVRYSNSTTGARENQVYVLSISDNAGANTTLPAINLVWYMRLRFIDN